MREKLSIFCQSYFSYRNKIGILATDANRSATMTLAVL